MPSSTALKMLVRTSQPTNEEWLALIEARRELLKPHLNSFTLSTLGLLECLRAVPFKHVLCDKDPKVVSDDKRLSLKAQGIFCACPAVYIPNSGFRGQERGRSYDKAPDGTMKIWGLTRFGTWIVALVTFVGEAGHKEFGYERATGVEIKQTTLLTLLQETGVKPRTVWEELSKVVHGWEGDRRALHETALRILEVVRAEDRALSAIPA